LGSRQVSWENTRNKHNETGVAWIGPAKQESCSTRAPPPPERHIFEKKEKKITGQENTHDSDVLRE
jgi:hypothetical protein